MRTIKFRGKDIQTGEWVYGSLFNGVAPTDNKPYSIILTDEKYDAEGHLPKDIVLGFHADETFVVDIKSIGQFTGLYDKNGKEIYEGDIVHSKLKRLRKYDEILQICFANSDYCGKDKSGSSTSLYLLEDYHTLEVIGNIHDTPELINGNYKEKEI